MRTPETSYDFNYCNKCLDLMYVWKKSVWNFSRSLMPKKAARSIRVWTSFYQRPQQPGMVHSKDHSPRNFIQMSFLSLKDKILWSKISIYHFECRNFFGNDWRWRSCFNNDTFMQRPLCISFKIFTHIPFQRGVLLLLLIRGIIVLVFTLP